MCCGAHPSSFHFICLEDGHKVTFIEFHEDRDYSLVEERLIINPGSVGQPRDRNPRPSYAIYDSLESTIQRHRVEYRIQETQEKMRYVHLPEYLIDRLNRGI